ncbi:MAG: hypothetical protein WAW61_10085, partial [Methylococcaceae bacterium]
PVSSCTDTPWKSSKGMKMPLNWSNFYPENNSSRCLRFLECHYLIKLHPQNPGLQNQWQQIKRRRLGKKVVALNSLL